MTAVDFLTLHVDVHTSVGFYGSFSLTQSRDILDLKKTNSNNKKLQNCAGLCGSLCETEGVLMKYELVLHASISAANYQRQKLLTIQVNDLI